jgi:hypothetical protein
MLENSRFDSARVLPHPIIDQIREVRHCISEECEHDPKKMIEYYMNLDRTKYADRLMKTKEEAEKSKEKK